MFTGASRFVVRSTEQASLARAPDRMRRLCCALIAGALLIQVSALAARNFPQSAKRGALTAHQYPYYTIDKSTRRIAVGGKIYNHHNLIIMPVSLQSQTAEIMYSVDTNGELSAIWLLTPEEAAKYPRATEPEPQPVPQPEPQPEPEPESES